MLLQTSTARAELLALLGAGDPCLGGQRLDVWRTYTLPSPPERVRNNAARCQDGRWWREHAHLTDPTLLLGHFRGEYALGGVHVDRTRVLVVDLDNRAGKADDSPHVYDPDLELRQLLAQAVLPTGLWIRSSSSGGLHRWGFFREDVDVEELAEAANARFARALDEHRDALAGLAPARRAFIEAAAFTPGGTHGYVELLPYSRRGSDGSVIRAPFGPGSALLLAGQAPITDPAQALDYLQAFVSGDGLLSFERFAPAPSRSRRPVAPRQAPAPSAPPPARRSPPPFDSANLAARLARADGRLPPDLRASIEELRSTAAELREHGLVAGSRHTATFILAFDAKLSGYTQQQAQTLITDLMAGPFGTHSKDFRRHPARAHGKTATIVGHVYRPLPVLKGAVARRRPPQPLRRSDLRALQALFPLDGALVRMAYDVLAYALANGRPGRDGTYTCEIAFDAVGARTRKGRRLFDSVLASGILTKLRGPRSLRLEARLVGGRMRGPQQPAPTLYRITWTYAEDGPFDTPPTGPRTRRPSRPLTSNPSVLPAKNAAPDTLYRSLDRTPSLTHEANSSVCPVGAVGAEGVKGTCGKVGAVSELSTVPSASTGPSEGGPGGDRSQTATNALRTVCLFGASRGLDPPETSAQARILAPSSGDFRRSRGPPGLSFRAAPLPVGDLSLAARRVFSDFSLTSLLVLLRCLFLPFVSLGVFLFARYYVCDKVRSG